VAIKVIVELQAKPGRRDELKSLLESMIASHGPSQRGFLGSTRYEVLENPDVLIEIADWESAEARVAHMQESAETRAYAGQCNHRRLRASAGDAGRAIEGNGRQAAALTIDRPADIDWVGVPVSAFRCQTPGRSLSRRRPAPPRTPP
jgi:quinol monooxygenase YgiN